MGMQLNDIFFSLRSALQCQFYKKNYTLKEKIKQKTCFKYDYCDDDTNKKITLMSGNGGGTTGIYERLCV